MRIVFGWHLDGTTYPETASGAAAVLGEAVVGPLGLLDIVETELGLGGPRSASAERVACWQARLAALDGPARFYHRSFATDPWATARTLLAWRDALVEAGWSGEAIAGSGERLDTLAALAALPTPELPLGRADRLRAVITGLHEGTTLDLERLDLIGDPQLLPAAWQSLLQALASCGVVVRAAEEVSVAPADTDLGRVQAALRREGATPLRGDGTLVVLTADDPWQAASACADWLAAGDNAGLVLLRDAEATLLDQACHDRGLPRPGAETPSRWRSALQVLPLAFEARWAPLNPQRLLELLTLPRGPVPPSIACLIADAVRDQPGIGGPAWQQAWQAVELRRRSQLGETLDPAQIEAHLARDLASWRAWLEGERFDPVAGMPVDEALAICRRVLQWASVRAGTFDDDLLAAAAAQAAACEAAMRAVRAERLSRVQIGRILDDVIGDGIVAGDAGAEAASWSVVDRPGQIWAAADTVLWWGFCGAPSLGALPWTRREHEALAAAGIAVESASTGIARHAEAWRRPLMHASSRLVLVQPRSAAGAATDSHPLWHEIVGLLGDAQHMLPVTMDAAELLSQPAFSLGGRTIRRVAASPAGLPGERPEWNVARGLVGLRDRESATSLTTLFGCRLAWVLEYAARLRSGALIAVPDDNRIIGTLAHAIVAMLFAEQSEWTAAAGRRRASELFEAELPRQAATLLLPDRVAVLAEARERVVAAVERLIELITRAGLRYEAAERELAGSIDGHSFAGTIDLLLRDEAGTPVILDLKWAKRSSYRRDELAAGKAVQLAAYSALVPGCGDGAGYFMLRQGELLFAGTRPFSEHRVAGGAGLDRTWAECAATWRHWMHALAAGTITAAGHPAEDEPPLVLDAPCRFCDFTALCGFTGDAR